MNTIRGAWIVGLLFTSLLLPGAASGADDDKVNQILGIAAALTGKGPAFGENFEAPAAANYTVVRAGQSFRTQRNTWAVESGSVDIVNTKVRTEIAPIDGSQLIDLAGSPGPGVMSTSFRTKPGTTYDFVVRFGRNNGIGQVPARATLQLVGAAPLLTQELLHDAARVPFNQILEYRGSFVADAASTTLRFISLNAGNYGLTVDAIGVSKSAAQPAAATAVVAPVAPAAFSVAGDYTYMGRGKATFTQSGDFVHGYSTWTPLGEGPHYEFRGKLAGGRITGEWYSILAQKGWFGWVARVQPNGDLDFGESVDPIRSNMNKSYLSKAR
jgi:hypothetical protein